MPRARRLLAVTLCFAAAIAALAQAQKRSITEKDIFHFNWIGDPQISPDGARVAFVKVTVDEKKTGYDTAIWSVSTRGDEQPRRMTDGKHDSSPRWSPDGKWLVFVRAPEPSAAMAAWRWRSRRGRSASAGGAALSAAGEWRRRIMEDHRSAARRGRAGVVARWQDDRLHQ